MRPCTQSMPPSNTLQSHGRLLFLSFSPIPRSSLLHECPCSLHAPVYRHPKMTPYALNLHLLLSKRQREISKTKYLSRSVYKPRVHAYPQTPRCCLPLHHHLNSRKERKKLLQSWPSRSNSLSLSLFALDPQVFTSSLSLSAFLSSLVPICVFLCLVLLPSGPRGRRTKRRKLTAISSA